MTRGGVFVEGLSILLCMIWVCWLVLIRICIIVFWQYIAVCLAMVFRASALVARLMVASSSMCWCLRVLTGRVGQGGYLGSRDVRYICGLAIVYGGRCILFLWLFVHYDQSWVDVSIVFVVFWARILLAFWHHTPYLSCTSFVKEMDLYHV